MASHSLIPIPAKKNGTLNQKTAPKSFSPLVMILSVPENKTQPQKPKHIPKKPKAVINCPQIFP
jgi:hypothetical protein